MRHHRIAIVFGLLVFSAGLLLMLTIMLSANPVVASSEGKPSSVLFADSDLDLSFGKAGIVTLSVPGEIFQVAALPDGKVLALLAQARNPDDPYDRPIRYLVRFNANGTLDASFGLDGRLPVLNINSNDCYLSAEGMSVAFWRA